MAPASWAMTLARAKRPSSSVSWDVMLFSLGRNKEIERFRDSKNGGLALVADEGDAAVLEAEGGVGGGGQDAVDGMVDDEKCADVGLHFVFDMVAEIGRMQDAAGKPLAAPFGKRHRTGAHGKAGRTGLRPAGGHAIFQTADAYIGLVAVDPDDL